MDKDKIILDHESQAAHIEFNHVESFAQAQHALIKLALDELELRNDPRPVAMLISGMLAETEYFRSSENRMAELPELAIAVVALTQAMLEKDTGQSQRSIGLTAICAALDSALRCSTESAERAAKTILDDIKKSIN